MCSFESNENDIKLRLLFEKYTYMKAFKSSLPYDDLPVDEATYLLMIHRRIEEVENKCMELNTKK